MIPAEMYTKWGLKIKKLSKSKYTFIICYANDDVGYIPDEKDFDRKDYASYLCPIIGGPFHFRRDVGKVLIEGIKKLLK
jgi:hypothetical protein